jgi:hypothetical protein
MLLHPPLARYVVEWQPPKAGALTAVFFASTLVAAALWGGHRRALETTERVLLPLLLLAAFAAVRNVVWFELAAAVSLPRLLDATWPSRPRATAEVRRVNRMFGLAAIAIVAAVAAGQLSRPPAFAGSYSAAAADAVAAAAGPTGVVLADDRHADWLLWLEPQLAGRVAYDARFELLTGGELHQLKQLDRAVPGVWRTCGRPARVVTFASRASAREVRRADVLPPGARTIVSTSGLVAVAQPATGASSCRL